MMNADRLNQPDLLHELLQEAAYPHGVGDLQVIETHISWVILTGEYAYKIKKPVKLGFLDFSSLEQRKFFCEEELRVNRRTAPELYIDIVPIGIENDKARIMAEPAIEYAVRMHQFPHEARLDRYVHAGLMEPGDIKVLAHTISRFHQSLPKRSNIDPAYEVERAVKPALNNFKHLDPAAFDEKSLRQLKAIKSWTRKQAKVLKPTFESRARRGFIRECHGDLHLKNLLVLDGRFIPFDAIEFNHELRWIDTANDIAFLAMDLMAQGHADQAWSLLNGWLEDGGDYDSLAVMAFYLVYRSMVRAVVTSIRQSQRNDRCHETTRVDAADYVDLAAALTSHPCPTLYLMHGFSGSGKTWVSERLIGELHAVRVRSDLERKRQDGIKPTHRDSGRIESGRYSPAGKDQTYRMLARICETGLRSGFNMIADATFLRSRHRDMFADVATALGAKLIILDCTAPVPELQRRIRQRQTEGHDVSDADISWLILIR
jgi:aminoglycoside phosphotransferase family enzyme/predicted kinase